jgi:hypothetical protein
MPLPAGTRYRVKTTEKGKKIRLAFLGEKVIEHTVMPKKKSKLQVALKA